MWWAFFGFIVILFAIGYTFTESGLLGGIYVIVGTAVAGGGLFYWMWTSGAWDRFVLGTTITGEGPGEDRENERRAKYLGKTGVAVTPLRPTGVARIDGETHRSRYGGGFYCSRKQRARRGHESPPVLCVAGGFGRALLRSRALHFFLRISHAKGRIRACSAVSCSALDAVFCSAMRPFVPRRRLFPLAPYAFSRLLPPARSFWTIRFQRGGR